MDARDIKEFCKDAIKIILVIVFALLLNIYVFSFQTIIGPSMQNTFNEGEIVLLNRLIYRLFDIKRNDVITLYNKESKYMVKRVIGLPGDEITYKDNILYINGNPTEEKFLKNTKTKDFSLSDLGYSKIPKDKYLVLGDNRTNSLDSRNPKIGLISRDDILGRVKIRLWPLIKIK